MSPRWGKTASHVGRGQCSSLDDPAGRMLILLGPTGWLIKKRVVMCTLWLFNMEHGPFIKGLYNYDDLPIQNADFP